MWSERPDFNLGERPFNALMIDGAREDFITHGIPQLNYDIGVERPLN